MSKNSSYYAVLMAGGVGSRFWPVSKESYPKQFHDMLGTGKSLLQSTFDRLAKLIPEENILILTNSQYKNLVTEQLPNITSNQIVLEPAMRNTAPCILLASLKIQQLNPEGVMIVAPSDHWIEDEDAFINDVQIAFDACETNDCLMTIGIEPTFPNTGYGYIRASKQAEKIKKVEKFTEKPDYATAKTFLNEGNYTWNAGIFIWSVSSILSSFQTHIPKLFDLFLQALPVLNTASESSFLEEHYAKAPNISIDYAILEKAPNISMISSSFDWNDLGTWGSLHQQIAQEEQQNVLINTNRKLLQDSTGNIIRTTKDKLVILEGLSDYIIVETKDTLLIVPKDREQEIKSIRQQAIDQYGDSFA
jgi:mannose-1-phosphate guanylyltransferase